jgi:integrase
LLNSHVSERDLAVEKVLDNASFSDCENVGSHELTIVGKAFNTFASYNSKHQVGASKEKAKNLELIPQKEWPAGGTTSAQTEPEVKGKVIGYGFYMEKQGYSPATIKLNMTALKVLSVRGANLLDPESVKEVISKQKAWSENRKRNVINAFNLFVKLNGMRWEKPKTKVTQKIPFIPREEELDSLISGSGQKTAAFLQCLKETAMRAGEAKRVKWIDIDFEKNIIRLNQPEKNSNARMWKVPVKLTAMLNALPKDSAYVFGLSSTTSMKSTFTRTRKRLAIKLQNPRLQQISFHTFRHWKATQEYHRTKDIFYVKDFLGHKELDNTQRYINIERTLFEPTSDDFTVRVAEKTEDVKALLEVGFEWVGQKDNLIFLRKRK